MNSCVRPMREEDLEYVRAWRNHSEIRRFMYTQHEISLLEHQRWYEDCVADPCRDLLIFEKSGIPIGFISFIQKTFGHIADWGFYIAPDAPPGTGKLLGEQALYFAFESRKFHKVCGQALEFNERSIRFHTRLGFSKEGLLRDQHYDGETFYSVIHFGLLLSEWQAR